MQVGAILFFIGCYATVIETANIHYSDRWHSWQINGEEGDPPKFRLYPVPTADAGKFISYYGCLVQFLGSVVFLVGAITELVGAHVPLSGAVLLWLNDIPFLLGGLLFVIGAYLLVSEGAPAFL